MKDAVLVLGYNNTRVKDVGKIRDKAGNYLNAKTVLCKKLPTKEDKAAADYVIDVDLDGNESNVNTVLQRCLELKINVIALLPFSDQGTQLGAALAKRLQLNGPAPDKINAALDKACFREREAQIETTPTGYVKIKSYRITSFEQLKNLYEDANGKLFLKPAKEGNSRGCINTAKETLENAWPQVSKYTEDGLVAEELIDQGNEYSWDHVSGYSWITEKQTTQNEHRAEIQQILPAPIHEKVSSLIATAGKFMSDISGSNGSACHNEIFYTEGTNSVIAVEPNLRPAGMRIWDLAAIAFEDFDPWKEWLLWAAGTNSSSPQKLKHNYYVGIRMIQAPKSGVLQKIKDINVADLHQASVEAVELTWTKKTGDQISHVVKDNSDFIGLLIARSKDYFQLVEMLKKTCNELCNEVTIQ